MAKSWGCKVISLDALLAELKRLKPLPKKGGKIKASCGVGGFIIISWLGITLITFCTIRCLATLLITVIVGLPKCHHYNYIDKFYCILL